MDPQRWETLRAAIANRPVEAAEEALQEPEQENEDRRRQCGQRHTHQNRPPVGSDRLLAERLVDDACVPFGGFLTRQTDCGRIPGGDRHDDQITDHEIRSLLPVEDGDLTWSTHGIAGQAPEAALEGAHACRGRKRADPLGDIEQRVPSHHDRDAIRSFGA